MIIFISLFVIGTIYINHISNELNEQYNAEKQLILEQTYQSVENKLAQIEFCNGVFQSNTLVTDYVENYDFTTADGVYLYLTSVKPVFLQIKSANKWIRDIHVYRNCL